MYEARMNCVTLASGEVLLQGEDLSIEEIGRALEARFPDPEERERQTEQVVVRYADGTSQRPWRFISEEPRVVGRTGYL